MAKSIQKIIAVAIILTGSVFADVGGDLCNASCSVGGTAKGTTPYTTVIKSEKGIEVMLENPRSNGLDYAIASNGEKTPYKVIVRDGNGDRVIEESPQSSRLNLNGSSASHERKDTPAYKTETVVYPSYDEVKRKTPTYCDDCCSSTVCCPCWNWCEGYEIGIDALVWKPCSNDLDFAVSSDESFIGGTVPATARISRHALHFDWEGGVRVHFKKSNVWCGWDLGASYTYIHPTKSEGLALQTGGSLQPVAWAHGSNSATVYATIKANTKTTYHSFDFLFSKDMCCGPCYRFTPFLGIEGLFLDDDRNYEALNGGRITTRNYDSSFWGVGLKLGSDFHYKLYDCLGLFAKASATLLTGRNNYSDFYSDTDGGEQEILVNFNLKGKDCICTPGYYLAFGLEYDRCWCGYDIGMVLSYEFLQWLNMPSLRRYTNDSSSNQILQSTDGHSGVWGFHGLSVGLKVGF